MAAMAEPEAALQVERAEQAQPSTGIMGEQAAILLPRVAEAVAEAVRQAVATTRMAEAVEQAVALRDKTIQAEEPVNTREAQLVTAFQIAITAYREVRARMARMARMVQMAWEQTLVCISTDFLIPVQAFRANTDKADRAVKAVEAVGEKMVFCATEAQAPEAEAEAEAVKVAKADRADKAVAAHSAFILWAMVRAV